MTHLDEYIIEIQRKIFSDIARLSKMVGREERHLQNPKDVHQELLTSAPAGITSSALQSFTSPRMPELCEIKHYASNHV